MADTKERPPNFEDFEKGDWTLRLDRGRASMGPVVPRVRWRDGILYSRQDCDDLIELLRVVRERLP
jgi:hypothetical protein